MDDNSHLPIAVRRTRRSLAAQTSIKQPQCSSPAPEVPEPRPPITPSKRSRSKKRVRFSDPGPALTSTEDGLLTTGLTPMIRRTCLSSARTSRRHSTPAQLFRASNGSGIPDLDAQGSPFSGEVRFLPLRQVLDGRVKRRIRRNGLSEEMNSICAERKQRGRESRAEMERLRAELVERDEEIARLHDETVVLDTDRVWNLEQQVAALKKELARRAGVQDIPSSPSYDWTRVARDPFSDGFTELGMDVDSDDVEFGESTMAELACSTPTRRMRNSFPTPPATSPSPAEIPTPCKRVVAVRFDTSAQTSLPDPEKRQLEEELESLQLEVRKLTATLESYSGLTSRLTDKLAPFSGQTAFEEGSSSVPHADIEARLTTALQTLSDRTAALAELNTSLKNLGFRGADAFEVIESLRTGFRTARLELEYLTPGEITLPLTSASAEVLDLLLTQLRALAKKNREADESIDEYHALEQSLRQQLNTRVDAMETLTSQLRTATSESQAKDARIADLELGLDCLKGTVRTYTRDLAELEAVVNKMEGKLAASTTALTEKSSAITSLEQKLAAAVDQITTLQSDLFALTDAHKTELSTRETAHKTEVTSLVQQHGAHLAQRDARMAALRAELEHARAALREACDMVQKLRLENGRLMREKDEVVLGREREREMARGVVDGVRAELERVVGLLVLGGGGVGSSAGKVDTGSAVRSSTRVGPGGAGLGSVSVSEEGRGRKRRRFDSALGFLDEEEIDAGPDE